MLTLAHIALDHGRGGRRLGLPLRSYQICSSTRRFFAMPSSVALSATGSIAGSANHEGIDLRDQVASEGMGDLERTSFRQAPDCHE